MSYISTAIGTERKSRVSGYKIKKGYFQNETPNLPQIIAILGEANDTNQSSISTDKREVTSAEEAGRIYGYGSPIHQIMRILRPVDSDGVGGIPTIVFPQLKEEGATKTEIVFAITGTSSKSSTHSIRIAGRENLDFQSYNFSISKNDTAAMIAQKIVDVINKNLSCPVSATVVSTNSVSIKTKWSGKTSAELQVGLNNNADNSGITYSQTTRTDGSGSVDILDALNQFQNDWITCVINPYKDDVFEFLEQFNGTPEQSSGRYSPNVFKPFMSFSGYTDSSVENLVSLTDNEDRQNQVTNVICPAPNSEGFTWEAAANVVRLFARIMQDSPESDINGMSYPDMPSPLNSDIGGMSEYNNRDLLIKKGCSTVIFNKGSYEVQDLVTTYHPEGENPLQFNYCRNLNLDWNVYDAYNILEKSKLRDKVLIKNDQLTESKNAIKPKEWKAVLYDLFDNLGQRALINEPSFSKNSLQVQVPSDNPNRFNTYFKYKRTGIARIESTTAEAGF